MAPVWADENKITSGLMSQPSRQAQIRYWLGRTRKSKTDECHEDKNLSQSGRTSLVHKKKTERLQTNKSIAGIDIWFACAMAETACEYSGA